MVEILEDCPPTQELLSAVKDMHELGYTIALDDFVPSKEWRAFLPYISIIKFDIRATPIPKARMFMDSLIGSDILFLAEKVETHEEFSQAIDAGFNYFQGYFFSKPELIQRKSLEPSFMTVIQLLTEISQPELNYSKIESLITKDVTMSYKLLTYVNSSSIVQSKIQSFKQALAYLGEEKLRKFISLVAIASTKDDKPDYLYGLSIQRARYCELLLRKVPTAMNAGQGFLVGMFSLLDSLLDRPIEQILEEIPVDEAIKRALIKGQGVLGSLLALVIAYEQAEWEKVQKLCERLKLNRTAMSECYDQSVQWTADLLSVQR